MVSEAWSKAYEKLYEDQGQIKRKIYKLAEYREKKTKDLDQVRCIKDEEEKVLVTNNGIRGKTSFILIGCKKEWFV